MKKTRLFVAAAGARRCFFFTLTTALFLAGQAWAGTPAEPGGATKASEAPRTLRPKLESVAVFDIRADLVSPELARIVNEIVLAELEHTRVFDHIYSFEEMKQVLDLESQKQLVGCDTRVCMAEISAALGARYIVVGSVGQLGETSVLSLSLVDNNDARTVARHQETFAKDPSRLLAATRLTVQKMIGQLGLGYLAISAVPDLTKVEVGPWVIGIAPFDYPVCVRSGRWKVRLTPPEREPVLREVELLPGRITAVSGLEPAGAHKAKAQAQSGAGHNKATALVAQPDDSGDEVEPTHESASRSIWPVPVAATAIGLGVLSLGGGAMLALLAGQRADQYRDSMVRDPALAEEATNLGLSGAGLLGGGALIATGGVVGLALFLTGGEPAAGGSVE